MRDLRPHQAQAITSLRSALASGSRRPMLMAPTGAGKTVLAAAIIERAMAKRNRVLFTVPKISLIDQTLREFWDEGVRDVGVIQSDHPQTDYSRPVQIASVQTLRRRQFPETDLVIIDEAHINHACIEDWMSRDDMLDVPFIGLSATPWAKGLGRLYDRLIIAATTQQLIDQEYLSPFKVFAPTHPDLSGVRTVAGDYHEGDLAQAMGKGTLTADIVSTWQRLGEGRPTLCFAVDRAHAKTLQAQFAAAGVACGYVDGSATREERETLRQQFKSGEIKVVCNIGVLTTGVDWDVRCIILARPTKSEMLYVQMIGRGLRRAPGKTECLILDHSDTTLRMGFVTDIHHEQLDDGTLSGKQKPPASEPKPKECPNCHYVRAPKVRTCPACGHVGATVSDVETVDGELVEMAAQRKANQAEWAAKVSFIAQLRAYAIQTGKADGWVSNKFRAKHGVWPNDSRLKYAPPAGTISPEVRSWIRAQNIRYAKAKERSGARVSA